MKKLLLNIVRGTCVGFTFGFIMEICGFQVRGNEGAWVLAFSCFYSIFKSIEQKIEEPPRVN